MILTHIVEQHASNAAFLWHLRDQATGQPHYRLPDIAQLDERVEAHIDGLRVAGDSGWEHCKAALAEGEAGEMFAATLLAVERHDLRGIAQILDTSDEKPGRSRGVVSALGWASDEDVEGVLAGLLDPECPPALHYLGVAGCAVRRIDPGPALDRALVSEDHRLRRRALDAAGELGRTDLLPIVERSIEDQDDGVRFSAARAATLLGSARAASALWQLADAGGPRAEAGLSMAVRRSGPRLAGTWIEALAGRVEGLRAAIVAAGALGDPAHVPWLLRAMEVPDTARIAGEAYCSITGASLELDGLERPRPQGLESGPNDDPEDEDVATSPDEDLLWPDVDRVRTHWQKSQTGLVPGKRYLLGKAITAQWLGQVLQDGGQWMRAAAAIELALLSPGQSLFEVRAPARKQAHPPSRGGATTMTDRVVQ